MYCKHCGTKNIEGSLYCVIDGVPLDSAKENLQVVKGAPKFCKSCSHAIGAIDNYCVECGQSTGVIQEKKALAVSIPNLGSNNKENHTYTESNEGFVTSLTSKSNIISAAKFAGIAFVIAIISSFILSGFLNSQIAGLFAGEIPSGLLDSLKLVSWTDVLMLMHLAGIQYSAEAFILSGSVAFKGGIAFLAVFPLIILGLVGFFANRNILEKPAIHRLKSALSIAVVYALAMAVFSLFAGISLEIPDPTGFLGTITAKADYQFFQVLKNTFILAFLFTFIGSLFGMKNVGSNAQFGVSIAQAVKTSFAGVLTSIILTGAVIGLSGEFEDMPTPVSAALSTQVGAYVWNGAHFNTVKGDFFDGHDGVKMSVSVLGGAKFEQTGYVEKASLAEGLSFLVYFVVLLPFIFYFFAGRKLSGSLTNNINKELAIFAVAVGIVNMMVYSVVNISIVSSFAIFDGMENIKLGFSLVTTFIFCAIYAFVGAYVGVLSSKKKQEYQSDSHNSVA